MVCGGGSSNTTGNGGSSDASDETITLIASAGFPQTDAGGQVFMYYCDRIEEYSEGKINLERYYGGTLAEMDEEWNFLSSGDINVTCNLPNYLMAAVPVVYGFNLVSERMRDALDIGLGIYFNGGEIEAAIDAACASYNFKMLGVTVSGNSVVGTSVKPVSSWQEMIDAKLVIGSPTNNDAYTAMGLNNVTGDPNDMYDSLYRGVYASCGISASGFSTTKLYEVAPYCVITNVVGLSSIPAMNLGTYNSLSPELQEAVRKAGLATSEYSVTVYADGETLLKNSRKEVTYLSLEDANLFNELLFEDFKNQLRSSSANLGDEMSATAELVINAAAETLGYSAG